MDRGSRAGLLLTFGRLDFISEGSNQAHSQDLPPTNTSHLLRAGPSRSGAPAELTAVSSFRNA